MAAAPPKRAAAPMAPVLMGMAGFDLEEVVAVEAAGTVEVGVDMPLVKGMPAVPVLAPLYAGDVVVAPACGVPVWLALRTLLIRPGQYQDARCAAISCHLGLEANSLVDDVDDAVAHENVGDRDLGAVDVDGAVDDGDVNVLARKCAHGTVHQAAAVAEAADDVVLEPLGDLLHGEVGEDAPDGVEGVVARGKDGQIAGGVERLVEAGEPDGTGGSGEVRGNKRRGDVCGYSEDRVDDMDCATSEVDVLCARGVRKMEFVRISP